MNLTLPATTTANGSGQDIRFVPPSASISADAFVLVLKDADTNPTLTLVKISTIVGSGAGGGTLPPISGSPEGVSTASPGTTVWDYTDQVLYVKETGTGNTGWKPTS